MLALTGHHLFGWLLSSHCLIQAISPDLSISTCPYPSHESIIKGLDFLSVIAGLSTRVLFTPCPAYNFPNSQHQQPFKLVASKGEKECVSLPGRLAIVWGNWKPPCSECPSSLLTTHPASCQSSWNTECWANNSVHRMFVRRHCLPSFKAHGFR